MKLFMKRSVQLLFMAVFVATAVTPACAQKKGLSKGVKNALGKKPPLTGTAPVVRPPVIPRVPPTVPNAAVPAPKVSPVSAAVERQVVQAQTAAQLPQQKDFLTGPQALQAFRPGWKSELMLSGFTRQQLDLVEQTFTETDQFLFETDEKGNWLSPRSAEWNYLDRYTKILTDNAWGEMALNDGQIKTLFGKFSRLDDVFTRLNLQSFLLTHEGRAPKKNAPGEEGKLARKVTYNVDKRDGNKMNPEVEKYVYSNMPAKLQTPTPSYGSKTRNQGRTPDEVLEQVQQFIKEHDDHFPSLYAQDSEEKSLRGAFDFACRKAEDQNLQDNTSRNLLALKEKYVSKIAAFRTPQEVYEQTIQFMKDNDGRFPSIHSKDPKEKSLRVAFKKACKKAEVQNLQDDTSLHLLALKEKYVKKIAAGRTSQEILEQVKMFMKKNDGRLPAVRVKDLEEKSLRHAFDFACKKAEEQNLQDETSLKLLALKKQWVKTPSQNDEE